MVRWAYDHACLHTCIYGGTTDGDRLVKATQTYNFVNVSNFLIVYASQVQQVGHFAEWYIWSSNSQ